MIIAGLLHPQEFWDLPSGLLYFLTVPSGYLLLTIFMLTNMHNVSWGELHTSITLLYLLVDLKYHCFVKQDEKN